MASHASTATTSASDMLLVDSATAVDDDMELLPSLRTASETTHSPDAVCMCASSKLMIPPGSISNTRSAYGRTTGTLFD